MKTKLFYLIVCFFLLIQPGLFAKEEMKCVSIRVKLVTKPNVIISRYITISFKGDRNRFKGIPSTLNRENSIINFETAGIDSLFFLVGNTANNKIICIPDVNMNHDFSDDYVYSFDKEMFNELSADHNQTITFKKHINKKLVTSKISFYPCLNDINDIHSITFCPKTVHYEGTFQLNGKKYITWARRGSNGNQEWVDYIVTDSLPSDLKAFNLKFNNHTKKILLDGYLIQSGTLNSENTVLTFQIAALKDLNKSELQGYDEGFYAPDLRDKDVMNGTEISLSQFKGNYILLDFWGTWCNPCISLLPHIAELHTKYKDLVIVSLATYENEKSVLRVPELIKKYQMNWVNFCDFDDAPAYRPNYTYNTSIYPTTILIDPEGKIIHRGSTGEIESLNKKLEQVFKY
ncbi:MAG: TlpA disulfide reductase family protein [Paludibacter sp.]|nr:TlpA disulfide reductase family protein [Paludibacter sp.]